MDKTRFTAGPNLDSEGFVMADARCHGCSPNEMCPRSGHCERYSSPLRCVADALLETRIALLPDGRPDGLITLGSDPIPPRDQFGRRYDVDSRGRYIGLDRRG